MAIIEIENQQKKIPLDPSRIITIIRKILKHEHIRQVNLSVAFVTDRKIRALNKRFLKRDHPTDVLAFDLTRTQGPSFAKASAGRRKIDGEIIISTITAYHNAKRFQTSPYREVILYVVHGILHLLGYDDHAPGDRKKMRLKEKQIMELVSTHLT